MSSELFKDLCDSFVGRLPWNDDCLLSVEILDEAVGSSWRRVIQPKGSEPTEENAQLSVAWRGLDDFQSVELGRYKLLGAVRAGVVHIDRSIDKEDSLIRALLTMASAPGDPRREKTGVNVFPFEGRGLSDVDLEGLISEVGLRWLLEAYCWAQCDALDILGLFDDFESAPISFVVEANDTTVGYALTTEGTRLVAPQDHPTLSTVTWSSSLAFGRYMTRELPITVAFADGTCSVSGSTEIALAVWDRVSRHGLY